MARVGDNSRGVFLHSFVGGRGLCFLGGLRSEAHTTAPRSVRIIWIKCGIHRLFSGIDDTV